MPDLIREVREALEGPCGVGRDDSVLVAVSGGPDSVFLLHVLSILFRSSSRSGELFAANLDHGIRGEESRLDSTFVAQLCGEWDVPLVTEAVDVNERRAPGESVEQAARRVRYEFLRATAEMFDAPFVATGHTANDQAETLLLRIERGTGIEGARSVLPARPIDPGSDITLVRPMLGITRPDILGFLRERMILWREDSTNRDTRYARNRIRSYLAAMPEEACSRLREALCALAASAARDWPRVRDAARGIVEDAVTVVDGGIEADLAGVAVEPPELGPYVARELVRMAAGDLRRVTSDHALRVAALLDGPSTGRVELPNGMAAVREYDRLRVGRFAGSAAGDVELVLTVPGAVDLPDGSRIEAERVEGDAVAAIKEAGDDSGVEYADAACLGGELVVRFRRDGDRFHPLGAPGGKSLKDFFIDAKVPRSARDRVPLVVSGERIAWVAGYRLGDGFRLGDAPADAVKLTLVRP